MTILQIEVEDARPVAARCDDRHLSVTLADGRVLQAPLWWYPRLLAASPDRRAVIELSPLGAHWPEIERRHQRCGHPARREGARSNRTPFSGAMTRRQHGGRSELTTDEIHPLLA